MKPRLLYLAAGNPISPSTGMSMVIREHIHELLKIDQIDLHGVIVLPSDLGKSEKCPEAPWANFRFFLGDLQNESSALKRLRNKLIAISSGKLLDHYSFRSKQARQHLRHEIESEYDIILVDSLIPLCNISIRNIRKYSSKIIFIAHTVAALEILDSGRLKHGLIKKFYHKLESFQSLLLQNAVIKMSEVSIFLSEWDRNFSTRKKQLRTIALCPTFNASRLETASRKDTTDAIRAVVFIGSPAFSPNRFAIDWIVDTMAIELFKVDPTISIILVGKGTEAYLGRHPGNVLGLGFVSNTELSLILQNCLALLSPVVHGSGIKIKILEAFAAGCPVLATENSLRGFEFMELEPKIDLRRPAIVVGEVVAFANDEKLRIQSRKKIRDKWAEYVSFRDGQLNNVILSMIDASAVK